MSWMTPVRRVSASVATPAPVPVPRRGPAKPLPVAAVPAPVAPAPAPAAPAATAAPALKRRGFGGIGAQAAQRVALKGKPRLTSRWRIGY